MTTASSTVFGINRAVFYAGLLFALNGVFNFATFLLFGAGDGVLNRAPIDLLPYYGIAVLVMAISADMGQKTLNARLTLLERICLYILLVALLGGLALNAASIEHAIDGLILRLPILALLVGLYYLLTLGGRAGAIWITAALALQTLLHLPIVAALYLGYVDDPQMNWLGGPVGYWHVRIWGIMLATGLAAALGLYAGGLTAGRPAALALMALVFVLLWTMLFWSGTRSGLAGLAAASLLSCLLLPRRFLPALPLFLACAAVGAALSLTLERPLDAYGILQSFNRDNGLTGMEDLSGGRMRMWLAAIGQLGEHPILGFGFNQYYDLGDQLSKHPHLHPHNAILQLLFDFGLVGGGAAILLIASFWLRGIAAVVRQDQTWKFGAMTALHALMVMSMFDGVLYHLDPLAAIALCFAVIFATPRDSSA